MTFSLFDPWKKCPVTAGKEALPWEMQQLVAGIEQCKTQRAALEWAYTQLAQKYRGYRLFTFLRLDRFFIRNIEKLWELHGFLHCNHMNYLLRTVLVASRKFGVADIESCWTQIWLFSPHQYLKVRLQDGSQVEVDLWGKSYGIALGDYAHGFHGGTMFKSV